MFQPLIDCLMQSDPYFVLADFQSYIEQHSHVGRVYADREQWARMSIWNTARSGKFSSDRTIREYCAEIWRAAPVPIRLLTADEVKADFLQ